ncbi:MAG: NAD(FAD)-utilizing dehydrogenase, partial [Eubacterium sp.]
MKKIRYRISNVKLKINEDWTALPGKVEGLCGLSKGSLTLGEITILKESIDARNKADIHRVYTLDFEYSGLLRGKGQKRATPAPETVEPVVIKGEEPLEYRPVVVGFGPCGIFSALYLAEAGYAPIVLERGTAMEHRVTDVEAFWQSGLLNPESNVLFGEGGAGTFSDGKLTTGTKDPRIRQVLQAFVDAGAPEDILYKQKPHIGTDV